MKVSVLKAAAIALLVGAMALALAQDGGQGRRGRGMMFRGGFGGGSSLGTLARKDVRADLAITDEQAKKLDELRAKNDEEMQAMRENMRASGGDFESMRTEMEKRNAATQKEVDAILTETQRTRLKEVTLQIRGNMSLMDEDFQKELAFTSDQKDKVAELQNKQQEAMMSLFEKRRNGDLDDDQLQDIMRKNVDIMGTELFKLLTPDQATKFKSMQGKPFKNTEGNGMTFRRGGRGGGG